MCHTVGVIIAARFLLIVFLAYLVLRPFDSDRRVVAHVTVDSVGSDGFFFGSLWLNQSDALSHYIYVHNLLRRTMHVKHGRDDPGSGIQYIPATVLCVRFLVGRHAQLSNRASRIWRLVGVWAAVASEIVDSC